MELKSQNKSGLMKAIRQHEFGGPEVLLYEDAPIPMLKQGEVLIRVHFVLGPAGFVPTPPDGYLRDGFKSLPPEWRPKGNFPLILGTDVSGVVEAVADDVRDFAVGDEVYSMVRFPEGLSVESGAYAEYITAPASQVALKPAAIDHIHAAAAPMSLLTAWQFMIEQGHNVPNPLQPKQHEPVPLEGKKVLINGAAGGVGHFALQLAKWKGAYVIVVASGKHEVLLRDLGADEFIDYIKTVPASGGAEAEQLGVTMSTTQVRSNGAQLAEVAKLLDNGTIRVVIDSVFPLADARKAHERAAQGSIQGKIVLTVA